MSDMAGKAARVCGRAQRELPRYNSVPRATPGAAAPAHEFEQTKWKWNAPKGADVSREAVLLFFCGCYVAYIFSVSVSQHFSLDSQLPTSPILFVTEPLLIRRWTFGVCLNFRLSTPCRAGASREGGSTLNFLIARHSSVVTGHFFSAFRLPPSAFRLQRSAFQFFSFSVFPHSIVIYGDSQ
jgi:hypothetical protein